MRTSRLAAAVLGGLAILAASATLAVILGISSRHTLSMVTLAAFLLACAQWLRGRLVQPRGPLSMELGKAALLAVPLAGGATALLLVTLGSRFGLPPDLGDELDRLLVVPAPVALAGSLYGASACGLFALRQARPAAREVPETASPRMLAWGLGCVLGAGGVGLALVALVRTSVLALLQLNLSSGVPMPWVRRACAVDAALRFEWLALSVTLALAAGVFLASLVVPRRRFWPFAGAGVVLAFVPAVLAGVLCATLAGQWRESKLTPTPQPGRRGAVALEVAEAVLRSVRERPAGAEETAAFAYVGPGVTQPARVSLSPDDRDSVFPRARPGARRPGPGPARVLLADGYAYSFGLVAMPADPQSPEARALPSGLSARRDVLLLAITVDAPGGGIGSLPSLFFSAIRPEAQR